MRLLWVSWVFLGNSVFGFCDCMILLKNLLVVVMFFFSVFNCMLNMFLVFFSVSWLVCVVVVVSWWV